MAFQVISEHHLVIMGGLFYGSYLDDCCVFDTRDEEIELLENCNIIKF